MTTMRQLKQCLDAKIHENRKNEQFYGQKLYDLSLQLDLSNTKLSNLQAAEASERKKYESEICLLKTQLCILQKENQNLKIGNPDNASRDGYLSNFQTQLVQMQQVNVQLQTDLKRSQELHRIQRKEIEAVAQLQSNRNGLKADHEKWLSDAYRRLECNYHQLQMQYAKLQSQSYSPPDGDGGRKVLRRSETETAPTGSRQNGSSEATPDTRLIQQGEETSISRQSRTNQSERAAETMHQSTINQQDKIVPVATSSQPQTGDQSRASKAIADISRRSTPSEAKKDLARGAATPDAENSQLRKTLELQRKNTEKEIKNLTEIVQNQNAELHDLRRTTLQSNAVIQAQEKSVRNSLAEKDKLSHRVSSLKKSLSQIKEEQAEADRLKEENAELKKELRKSLDLVRTQAHLLKKEKKVFWDEAESAVSISDASHYVFTDGQELDDGPSENDLAYSEAGSQENVQETETDASSTDLQEENRRKTNPEVVVTSASGETDTEGLTETEREMKKKKGVKHSETKRSSAHLHVPSKTTLQNQRSTKASR